MCTANPFPVLTIGDGLNNDKEKLLKTVGTKNEAYMNELNPEFLHMYELDAQLPEDWKLKIEIFDKQNLVTPLIGKTEIDLENRRHSDLLFLNRESIQLELQQVQDKLKAFNQLKQKKMKGAKGAEMEKLKTRFQ